MKHIFILGAGASKPYEYPTGAELISEAKKKVSYIHHIRKYHLANLHITNNTYDPTELFINAYVQNKWYELNLSEKLHWADYESFDEILKINKELSDCGK